MTAKNIFEKLDRGRPPIEKAQEISPAQRLLDFLQRWPRDVISVRDIRQFGPGTIRTQRGVINTAAILEKHGWLARIQGPYRNSRQWQVVRRATIHPTV